MRLNEVYLLNKDIKGMSDFAYGVKFFLKNDEFDNDDYTHDVLFSGGFDSTLILLYLATMKKKINVISVHGTGVEYMNKKEEEARENILNKIKKDFDIEIEESNINIEVFSGARKAGFFTQHLFTSAAMTCTSDKSILYTGFIGDDTSTIRFNHLQEMVSSINNFFLKENDTILCNPLFDFSKADVIYNLKYSFPEYYNLIWTCQSPIYLDDEIRPCVHCPKCKSHIDALQTINHRNEITNYKRLELLEYDINHKIEIDKREKELTGELNLCTTTVND